MTVAEMDLIATLRSERDKLFDKQQDYWRLYQQAIRAQQAIDHAIDGILQQRVNEKGEAA